MPAVGKRSCSHFIVCTAGAVLGSLEHASCRSGVDLEHDPPAAVTFRGHIAEIFSVPSSRRKWAMSTATTLVT